MGTQLKMYAELARWWPLISAPEEYAEEAEFNWHTLAAACATPPKTMLELGSGGGNNAFHMKRHVQPTLVDLSVDMLKVSRALNPDCEHARGDMRTVRLERTFDCVFIHDAICYMTSEDDLRRALSTAWLHCAPGGAVLVVPDHVRESFGESTDHGGRDADDGRGLRYLEWTWDPDPNDTRYTVDYVYLLRETDGSVNVEHDQHVEGLFARGDWLRLLGEVGFAEPRMLPLVHSELEPGECEMFVAVRV